MRFYREKKVTFKRLWEDSISSHLVEKFVKIMEVGKDVRIFPQWLEINYREEKEEIMFSSLHVLN